MFVDIYNINNMVQVLFQTFSPTTIEHMTNIGNFCRVINWWKV